MTKLVDSYPFPPSAPEFPLPTRYGTPTITAVGRHLMVTGGIPHNVETGEPSALTLRGVSYSVQCHMHLWSEDGNYHCGAPVYHRQFDGRDPSGPYQDWHEPRLSRRDWSGKEPTMAAGDAVRAELERVVNEWAKANPDEIAAGVRREETRNAHTLACQIDKKREELATLEAELLACVEGKEVSPYPLTRK